jgi:nucleoside-diphosphate-sugar epimerase
MRSLLVTGAEGFVGSRLCHVAAAQGFSVAAAIRGSCSTVFDGRIRVVPVGDIALDVDWMPALRGIDVVIHLAGRAHLRNGPSGMSLREFRRVNVDGTRRLAEAAARAGGERVVYVSSIKVNGEATEERPFTEADPPVPQDPYAVSKWEAEVLLRDLSERTGMGVVMVRPPLVYGPGVKGNLLTLMRHIDKGVPLPLGNIDNSRSLIALDNLVDALILVSSVSAAVGETYLVSDERTVSTGELGRCIAHAMGKKVRLIGIPRSLARALTGLFPPSMPLVQRLTGSLVVDSSKIRRALGWAPRQTFTEGIDSMVQAYCKIKRT